MTTKRQTQAETILRRLIIGGWVANHELNRIAFRYSARIMELRRSEFVISKWKDRDGVWYYRLETPIADIDLETMTVKSKPKVQEELF